LSDPFLTFNFDGLEFETEIKEKSKQYIIIMHVITLWLALNPVFDFRKEFKYTVRAKDIDIVHQKLVKITVTDYDRVCDMVRLGRN